MLFLITVYIAFINAKWLIDTEWLMSGTIIRQYMRVYLPYLLFLAIVLFMLARFGTCFRFRLSGLCLYYAFFVGYCFINCLWAAHPKDAISKSTDLMIYALISLFFLEIIEQREYDLDDYLSVVMIAGFVFLALYVARYGISELLFLASEDLRVTSDFFNANKLGRAAIYPCVILCYLCLKKKGYKRWIPFSALSLFILFLSQSRQSLITLLIGLLIVLISYYHNSKNTRKILLFFMGVIVICTTVFILLRVNGVTISYAERFSNLSGFIGEGKGDRSTDLRSRFLALGWELFASHPVGGIGIDGAKYFAEEAINKFYNLHNNYIELLADGGLVGLIAYYWIYVVFLINMIRFRNVHIPEYGICLAILIMRMIGDLFFYAYNDEMSYVYLLLLYLYNRRFLPLGSEDDYSSGSALPVTE